MSTSSKVLVAALAGIAIGAVAGLLLAPESGENLRKRLIKKGNDAKDDLANKFEESIDSLNGLKNEWLGNVHETAADVAIKAEKAKHM